MSRFSPMAVFIQRATLVGPRGGRVNGLVALDSRSGEIVALDSHRKPAPFADTISRLNGTSVSWSMKPGLYPYDVSIRRFERSLDPVDPLDKIRSHA